MLPLLFRLLGHKAAHNTIAAHTKDGGFLDVKLGLALLRDRRVPLLTKLLALGLGAGLMAFLLDLEAPLELVMGLLLGPLGMGIDLVADGLEAIAGPFLISGLLLPHLAPKAVVEQVRLERAGLQGGPVIDVESRPAPAARPSRRWGLIR